MPSGCGMFVVDLPAGYRYVRTFSIKEKEDACEVNEGCGVICTILTRSNTNVGGLGSCLRFSHFDQNWIGITKNRYFNLESSSHVSCLFRWKSLLRFT